MTKDMAQNPSDFTHREAEKPVVVGYTPGPWEAFNSPYGWCVCPVSGGGMGWAMTEDGDFDSYLSITLTSGDGGQRSEANARLIAAAPELLEAAQGLLAAYKALADAYGNEAFLGAQKHPASWAAKTESAIAKALGQQAAVSPDTQVGTETKSECAK